LGWHGHSVTNLCALQVDKIGRFTAKTVEELRARLYQLQKRLNDTTDGAEKKKLMGVRIFVRFYLLEH